MYKYFASERKNTRKNVILIRKRKKVLLLLKEKWGVERTKEIFTTSQFCLEFTKIMSFFISE